MRNNPKKDKSARRKAKPTWRKARATHKMIFVPDPNKPLNKMKTVIVSV